MKAFKWIGTAAFAALLMLTSCLGNSDNTITRRGFGVGGYSKMSVPIVHTSMGQLSSPTLGSQIVDGTSYVINYEVDFNSPENENAMINEYYTAKITILDEIANGECVFYQTSDTTALMSNEIAVKNVAISPDYGAYVGGHLFLFNAVDMVKEQKNSYSLYWNRADEPNRELDLPVYNLFLRATKLADGSGTTLATTTDVRSFNIKTVLESVNKAEKDKGSKGYVLKINYITGVDQKDSTKMKWSSLKVPFAVQ